MEPSDEEIMGLMPQQMHEDLAAVVRAMAEQEGISSTPAKGVMRIILNRHVVDLARAVLARYGHQPAPPTEGEMADLIAWLGDEADQYDCIQQSAETSHKLRRAAYLLAHHHPAPPTEGEVGELIERLNLISVGMDAIGHESDSWFVARAATLLKRRHPAPVPEEAANPWKDALIDALVCNFLLNKENESDPKKALHDLISWELELARDLSISLLMRPVPVSERLPGPGDCDGEGRCWWEFAGSDDYGPSWTLMKMHGIPSDMTRWLPAWVHALPLPAVEVKP